MTGKEKNLAPILELYNSKKSDRNRLRKLALFLSICLCIVALILYYANNMNGMILGSCFIGASLTITFCINFYMKKITADIRFLEEMFINDNPKYDVRLKFQD